MSQSKKRSFFEVAVSTAIGYFAALATQIIVFPLFDIKVEFSDQLAIGVIFTIVSVARGYLVRRLFNYLAYGRQAVRKYNSKGL
jgi:hypothetical protein